MDNFEKTVKQAKDILFAAVHRRNFSSTFGLSRRRVDGKPLTKICLTQSVVFTTFEAMRPETMKRLRQSLGMTQKQFARAIGVNRVTVADWEGGAHKPRGLSLVALNALAAKAKRRQK